MTTYRGAAILPAATESRQGFEDQLHDVAGGGRDRGLATAADAGDPQDAHAVLHDGQPGALPAGNLLVDQERLQAPLAGGERREAIAATAGAHGEARRHERRVEGDA